MNVEKSCWGHVAFTGYGRCPETGSRLTRDLWKQIARDAGFHPVKRVGYETRFLVCEPTFDSASVSRAKQLGVKIISYETFHGMCKNLPNNSVEVENEPTPIDTSQMEHIEGWGCF